MIYCYKPNAQDYTVKNIPTGGVCTDQKLIEDFNLGYYSDRRNGNRRRLANKQIFIWGGSGNVEGSIESAKKDLENSLEDLRAIDSHGWTNRFWVACSKAIIEHLTEMKEKVTN
tara:strand:- start:2570 stop:2911 length:342 start_codon:yes stop_codon:yes gene_type:complete